MPQQFAYYISSTSLAIYHLFRKLTVQLLDCYYSCRWLDLSKERRRWSRLRISLYDGIFVFPTSVIRLSCDYKEAGSEPCDYFLAVKWGRVDISKPGLGSVSCRAPSRK